MRRRLTLITRTFWLLVLYGARRLCAESVPIRHFIASRRDILIDATYVGESVGRHFDRFPGGSVGDICRAV